MTVQAIETLIERQASLLAALDSNDVSAIEIATREMANAVETVRMQDAWHDRSTLDRLDYAMKQTQAARIRVNCLSEWTRQKIDRLSDLRGIEIRPKHCKY